MIYELWDIKQLTESDEPMPFSLITRSENFFEVYNEFVKQYKLENLCVIILNKQNPIVIGKENIFESPDGGKTIYKRKFLDYNNREKL